MSRTQVAAVLASVALGLAACGGDQTREDATTAGKGRQASTGGSGTGEASEPTSAVSARPSCTVRGSFTPDDSQETGEKPTLADIEAQRFPAYELDGPAAGLRFWSTTARGTVGGSGPLKTYGVEFYDDAASVGFNVDITLFATSPTKSKVEVRAFDKPIGTTTSRSKVVTWGVDEKTVDAAGLADDGSGGRITFVTARGGRSESTGNSTYFYPVRVDLDFSDCPPAE
ncbi:hypothetical protein [Actinokineospora pegani]|uniref:hypothetical protein n=1 Tax=Actinokineospora pegani TaxID=2654637 RepID=UPI0012E9ED2A|nr:hypothetical protein [Actinokineospora pegani]